VGVTVGVAALVGVGVPTEQSFPVCQRPQTGYLPEPVAVDPVGDVVLLGGGALVAVGGV